MKGSSSLELDYCIPRGINAVKCPACGGYAERTEVTREEDKKYGCGRFSCCSAAFICGLCDSRIVGNREAPEMDFN